VHQQLFLEQKLHLLDQQLHLDQQLMFDQELQKQNLLQDLSLGSISVMRKMLSIFWHSSIFANTDMTEQWLVQQFMNLFGQPHVQLFCQQLVILFK
jgi:hypothetical protein